MSESTGVGGKFITRRDACDIAHCTLPTIDKWLRQPGAPVTHKIGRHVLIDRESFLAWISARKGISAKAPARDPGEPDMSLLNKPLAEIDLTDPATVRALHAALKRAVEEDRAAGIEFPAIDVRDPATLQAVSEALKREPEGGEGGQ